MLHVAKVTFWFVFNQQSWGFLNALFVPPNFISEHHLVEGKKSGSTNDKKSGCFDEYAQRKRGEQIS